MRPFLFIAAALALTIVPQTLFAQTFGNYRCADGSVVPAVFYDDTRSVSIQIDGKSLRLPRRLLSVSGARYAKGGVTLRIKGQTVTLKRKGQRAVACTSD